MFARQRYWGEPFPVIFLNDTGESKAVNEDDLPITLPELDDFSPSGTGDPPLSKAVDWVSSENNKSLLRSILMYLRWDCDFQGKCRY